MDIAFHHVGISVPDLEASIAWYREMFGFELERRSYLPPASAKVAFLKRGVMRLELFEPEGGEAMPESRLQPDTDIRTHGTKHVCFAVKDAAAAAEELRGKGADIVFVKQMPHTTVAFLRDNAGMLVELFQEPELLEG